MTDNSTQTSPAQASQDNAVNYKTSLTAIRKARRFVVQGLYEWLLTGNPSHEIEAHTRSENAMHTVHLGYYHELLSKIIEQSDDLIAYIDSLLDRPWTRLDKVEQAVLLVGAYEMKQRGSALQSSDWWSDSSIPILAHQMAIKWFMWWWIKSPKTRVCLK